MNTKTCPDCGFRMVKVGNAAQWWNCPACGATAPLRRPSPSPDTSIRNLGAERRAWLVTKFGSITAGVKRLIDDEMSAEE